MIDYCSEGCSKGLKIEKCSENSKNDYPVSGTPVICDHPVSGTPVIGDTGDFFLIIQNLNLPVSGTLANYDYPVSGTLANYDYPVSGTLVNYDYPLSRTQDSRILSLSLFSSSSSCKIYF